MSGPSNQTLPTPKAIASLAKRPDVTRSGSQKLKFVPTLPARRRKDGDIKQEDPPPSTASPLPRDRGRGRGRGHGGDGRGAAPRPPPVEMTASGPFAMGPSLLGAGGRRSTPRSNFTPAPLGPTEKLGSGLTQTTAPSLKKEKEEDPLTDGDDDGEVYSEPDEGVEIIDMDDVRKMDWMAPETLQRESEDKKRKKKEARIKKSDETAMEIDEPIGTDNVNLANAVDLSESEEEEELEDIIDDFSVGTDQIVDPDVRQERLYLFQFPSPFPTFTSNANKPISVDKGKGKAIESPKRVTFADDPTAATPSATVPNETASSEKAGDAKVDGVIGQLEVYRSGAVKMRLANGILMDVTAATQPSFLQHSVYLDRKGKRLCVLGEINRRFVVTPDIESLLADIETSDDPPGFGGPGDLISMDTT